MAFHDLSGLPHPTPDMGNPPMSDPTFAPLLAAEWASVEARKDLRPLESNGHRTYYTMAGKCARTISYLVRMRDALIAYEGPRWSLYDYDEGRVIEEFEHAKDAAPSGNETLLINEDYRQFHLALEQAIGPEAIDLATYWTFGVGTSVHTRWQTILEYHVPGVRTEVESFIPDIDCHGYADAVKYRPVHEPSADIPLPQEEVASEVIEIKSVNGFGFKMMVGARGPAEGPRHSALLQGALNAFALETELRMVYVAIEKLSDRELAKIGGGEPHRKFLAEWHYTRDEVAALAEPEIDRIGKILKGLDDGIIAPRNVVGSDIHPKAQVTDPTKGTWMVLDAEGQVLDSGSHWECNYCSWRPRCITDGPGRPSSAIDVTITSDDAVAS